MVDWCVMGSDRYGEKTIEKRKSAGGDVNAGMVVRVWLEEGSKKGEKADTRRWIGSEGGRNETMLIRTRHNRHAGSGIYSDTVLYCTAVDVGVGDGLEGRTMSGEG